MNSSEKCLRSDWCDRKNYETINGFFERLLFTYENFIRYGDNFVLIFRMFKFCTKEQTRNIEEKQASVMAELSQVEPAVQEAKMGKRFCNVNFRLQYRV